MELYHQNHRQLIRVVEREGVDRLGIQTSTRERVPLPSYRNGKGEMQVAHKCHTQEV